MLEDKLPELIRGSYSLKILVAASYKAKESLAAKGLTPAIFLDRFYHDKETVKSMEIGYSFKDKFLRPMPDISLIDLADFDFARKEDRDSIEGIDQIAVNKRILQQLHTEKIKYQREVDRQVFNDRPSVQKFLNNQSFHWFDKSIKYFYHATSLGQFNYRTSTIDQPLSIVYLIEVQKQKSLQDVFEKIKYQTDMLMKKLYQLNPDQLKVIRPLVLIMFDVSQGAKIEEGLQYTNSLKKEFGISSSLIYRLQINGEDLHDSIQWSRFNRPLLHFNYQLKASDPLRIVAYEEFSKVQDMVNHHKETMRAALENRLMDLCRKHEQINKTLNKLSSFFKGNTPTDKNYVKDEVQMRQLADRLFILEDYRKAYDIYKNLSEKLSNRNPFIEQNLAEMIHLCLAMSKFLGIKIRSDPYSQVERYAGKILSFYQQRSTLRHKKYLIFLLYTIHAMKVFNKQFIKQIFYNQLKASFSQSSPNLNVLPLLLYEQYANLNLLYPKIDFRKYCFDLTRVASRFSDSKLHEYALRCLLIVQALYRDTFANIQKYQLIQLSHLFSEMKNYRQSVKYLKEAWNIYVNRIENQDLPKDDSQLTKLSQNYWKVMRSIEKEASQELQELILPNLQIPVVQSLNLQTAEEMLQFDQKSGLKWQFIGQSILENKQLMSQGLSQKKYSRMFQSFDTGIPEEKYLIHRFKYDEMLNPAIIAKNSREAFANEPIKISFYFRNPLRNDFQIDEIFLKWKNTYTAFEKPENQIHKIEAFKSQKVTFFIKPTEPGFLQLQAIYWNFMKLITEYRIKEPGQLPTPEKSCYFKLNILPGSGRLSCKAEFQDHYHEGERGKMMIKFTNEGVKSIDQIYIAVGEEQMFGFRFKNLQLKLQPQESKSITLDIDLPVISEGIQSGEEKKICKIIILYETDDKFRVSRTINKFNVVRVAKIDKLLCERLSTHLHLLSFTKKTQDQPIDNAVLQWMVLPQGFQIVKTEAAQLSSETNYFFFIRKGNFGISSHNFLNHQTQQKYPEELFHSAIMGEDNSSSVEIKFLWKKDNGFGCIRPPKVPIRINKQGYISTDFPINFKISYEKQVQNNFNLQPYYEVPVLIKLKNILEKQQLKVTVFFTDSKQLDSSWEGIIERKITLSGRQEVRIDLKYVVMRPGIYDLSKEIVYIIENSKGQQTNITHSEYQSIYLSVSNTGAGQQANSSPDFEDAFKEFQEIHQPKKSDSLPKRMAEQQSLI